MVDILNAVGIKAQSSRVYDALTTLKGLSGWWTGDTTGDTNVGGVIHFRFGDRGFIDMRVRELAPDGRVAWQVVDGPAAWIGTKVMFELRQDGDFTTVLFKHEGWKEPVEFMHHCSTKWATYLLSLKELVETGTGRPSPDDLRITDWD
jgi:uncharacterized protein YndB with AHSA1/START domain